MRNFFVVALTVLAIVIGFYSVSLAKDYTAEELEMMEVMKDNITEIQLYFIEVEGECYCDTEEVIKNLPFTQGRSIFEDDALFSFEIPVVNREYETVIEGIYPGKYMVEALAIGNPVAESNEWVEKPAYFIAFACLEVAFGGFNVLKLSFQPAGNPVRLILPEGEFPSRAWISIDGIVSYNFNDKQYRKNVFPFTDNNGNLVVDTYIPWGATSLYFDYFNNQGRLAKNRFFLGEMTIVDGETQPSPVEERPTLVEMEIEFPE